MSDADVMPSSGSSQPSKSDKDNPKVQNVGTASRIMALDVLQGVLQKKQPFDIVFDQHPGLYQLSPRDRRFVRMLTATTIRYLGQIDELIQMAMEQLEPPQPDMLHNLLRIGVTQLYFMNVPNHAAIDTAVRVAHQKNLRKQKGLVNAVLRRISKDGAKWMAEQDAVTMNMPSWLIELWQNSYGAEQARMISEASLSQASLDLTPLHEQAFQKLSALDGAVPLPFGSIRFHDAPPVSDIPGFEEGEWWVQDVSASLPVKLLGDVTGKTVVDLCAAPGGKTAQLAAQGAHVIAIDRSAKRLKRLQENMARLGLSDRVEVVVADASSWTPTAPIDAILLDAPCTATGTIRRHPDVMRSKTSQDMENIMQAQSRLLNHAISLLPSGGKLVYCTCSLQTEEGEAQIDRLLSSSDIAMSRMSVTAKELGGVEEIINEKGDVRCLPFYLAAFGGMDGFFAARLAKA